MKASVIPVILVAVSPIAAFAAEPVVLAPTSKWIVDYAEQKCRLLRTFGSDKQESLLSLEQSAPGDDFTMTLAGAPLKGFAEAKLAVAFADQEEELRKQPFAGTVDDYGPALIFSSMAFGPTDDAGSKKFPHAFPQINISEAARADFVDVRRGNRQVRFDTGNMAKPAAALNACTTDLTRSWGLDPERLRTATRGPVWTNSDRIVDRITSYYPKEAVQKGERGILHMRVIVSADGSVTSCTLENTTRLGSLESPACEEMKRARFEPALDAQGTPMPSLYSTSIVYTMG